MCDMLWLLFEQNENYTYQCVISYNGIEARIPAEYTGPNYSLLCIPAVDNFTQLDYVSDGTVSVLWTGPNTFTYYLETEVDPLTGMIYVYCVYVHIYLNSDIV